VGDEKGGEFGEFYQLKGGRRGGGPGLSGIYRLALLDH